MRFLLSALSLLLTCVVFAQEAQREDESKDFDRAHELFKKGEEEHALVSLSDFLRRYPQSQWADDAQYMVGVIEFRKRNFKEAVFELQKTLAYQSAKGVDRIADAALLLGESWFRLGEHERALIEWQALIRKFPKSAPAEQARLRIQEIKKVESDKK